MIAELGRRLGVDGDDMIRFGHFEDEYFPHYKSFPTANFEKTRRVFPINKSMLDLNPKWTQNNGY